MLRRALDEGEERKRSGNFVPEELAVNVLWRKFKRLLNIVKMNSFTVGACAGYRGAGNQHLRCRCRLPVPLKVQLPVP